MFGYRYIIKILDLHSVSLRVYPVCKRRKRQNSLRMLPVETYNNVLLCHVRLYHVCRLTLDKRFRQ